MARRRQAESLRLASLRIVVKDRSKVFVRSTAESHFRASRTLFAVAEDSGRTVSAVVEAALLRTLPEERAM